MNWFTPANWNTAVDGSGDAASELVSGDSFTFGTAIASATAINYNPSVDDFAIGTITFASGCGAVTVSGSPIASVGKMVNETSTIQTFQNAVQFSSTVNMTGPSAWNDACITFAAEGGATGTYPENYRYFRGKQTFTTATFTLSGRNFVAYPGSDVLFTGNVNESYSPVYRLYINEGAKLTINGYLDAGRQASGTGSSGNPCPFGRVDGIAIVKGAYVYMHAKATGIGATFVDETMGPDGVIALKRFLIELYHGGRQCDISKLRRLALLPGGDQSLSSGTDYGIVNWPDVLEIGAATGDATFTTYRTCTSQSSDIYKPRTIAFNTIDMLDKTTPRNINFNGTLVGTAFDTSPLLKLVAFGAGRFVVNKEISTVATGGARFVGGFTASNGVTVVMNGAGYRPSTGPFAMQSGTTLSIPSSVTTGEIGGSGTVSFDADSTLAVNFSSTAAAPVLALSSGSSLSLPETGSMKVKVSANEGLVFDFGTEYEITSGGKFAADAVTSGKVVLSEGSVSWATLFVNASGNLAVVRKPYFTIKVR